MDSFNSDILMSVLQYLNVIDSGHFATTCRRHYYLVHQYRTLRGPELVAVTSSSSSSSNQQQIQQIQQLHPSQVTHNAIVQLQTKPNLGLGFLNRNTNNSMFPYHLVHQIPNDTIVLCSQAHSIQSANCSKSTTSTTTTSSSNSQKHQDLEYKSHNALFLANLPNAKITPFYYDGMELLQDRTPITTIAEQLANRLTTTTTTNSTTTSTTTTTTTTTTVTKDDYKLFIVYGSGQGGSSVADSFVKALQAQFPNAAIVGGICTDFFVSLPVMNAPFVNQAVWELSEHMTTRQLLDLYQGLGGGGVTQHPGITKTALAQMVYDLIQIKQYYLKQGGEDVGGIGGIALAGDVPVQSVVSRGVVSLTQQQQQQQSSASESALDDSFSSYLPPPAKTPYYVHEASYVRPGDEEYMFSGGGGGNLLPSYHIIRRIRDVDTDKVYTPNELDHKFGSADFIGIRKPNQDGFSLEQPNYISDSINAYVFISENPQQQQQQQQMEEEEESLVGANIDFYCLDGDACLRDMEICMSRLKQQTHGRELLGAVMYSCSARGPRAGLMISKDMADASLFAKEFPNVPCLGFYAGGEIGPLALAARTESVFSTGNACLQGFTAVFALFIVPVVNVDSMELDDCTENIEALLQERLHSKHS